MIKKSYLKGKFFDIEISFIMVYVAVLLFCSFSIAQTNDVMIFHKPAHFHPPHQPLNVELVVENTIYPVSQVTLHYRVKGQTIYVESAMRFDFGVYRDFVPAEFVSDDGLEYFFIVHLMDGSIYGFPQNVDPHLSPIEVKTRENDNTDSSIDVGDGNYLILSPLESETVVSDDVLIAVSLFNAKSVEFSSIKIFLDGKNVTDKSEILPELITYQPENLSIDHHTVEIEMSDKRGKKFPPKKWDFFTVRSEKDLHRDVIWNSKLSTKSRNEFLEMETDTIENIINKVNFSNNFDFGWLKLHTGLYVTTEEEKTKQPRNRYFLSAETEILKFSIGDVYPRVTPLTMWGARVRGFEGSLRLGSWNFLVSRGNIIRKVLPNQEISTTRDTLTSSELENSTYYYQDIDTVLTLNDSTFIVDTNRKTSGMFDRTTDAFRISFGKGHYFQWGISGIHSRDDQYSLDLSDSLDAAATNKPRDNLIVGTDVLFALDNHRTLLMLDASFSLENRNIETGPYTMSQLDTLADNDVDSMIIGYIPIAVDPSMFQDYFIFNGSMIPVDPTGATSIAATAKLRMNYLKNLVQITGRWIGPDYVSYTNPYIRKDIYGIEMSDYIRMFNDHLYLRFGGEYYRDNLAANREATTTNLSTNASIALYLGRQNFFGKMMTLPNLNFSFRNNSRLNNKTELTIYEYDYDAEPDTVDYRVNDDTQTFTGSIAYSLPLRETVHQLNLSTVASERIDLYNRNQYENNTIFYSISMRSMWSSKLNTTLAYSTNANQSSSAEFQFNVYSFLLDLTAYHRQIHLISGIKFVESSGTSDFQRLAVNGVVNWRFLPQHILTLSFNNAWRTSSETGKTFQEKQMLLQYSFNLSN